MIDHIMFIPDLGSNTGSNVPFGNDTTQSYKNVGAGIFKHPSVMGIFTRPPPSPTTHIAHINMLPSFTSGSLGSFDPWVIPRPKDFDSYGASMSSTTFDIIDLTIPSTFIDSGQQLHPHMDCDNPTPPIWVVDSPSSHDFLDNELPSEEAILEVMSSLDKPTDEVMHPSYFLSFELTIVIMASLNTGLGEFVGASIETPNIDPFPPWLSFSKLATKLFVSPSIEYLHFVPPSCVDGCHQGDNVAQETTYDEYLQP
jgi:hypothetical protein